MTRLPPPAETLPKTKVRQPIATERSFALTPTQRDLYLDSVRRQDPTVYNLGFLVSLGERWLPRQWQEAVSAVVASDPFLRIHFLEDGGELRQLVNPDLTVPHRFVDLEETTSPSLTPEEFLEEKRREPFDLANGPLFRSFLIRDPSGAYWAGLVTTHLVFDEFSAKALWQRISAAYSQLDAGQPPASAPATSFFHYQQEITARFDTAECLEYWSRAGREIIAPGFDTVAGTTGEAPNEVRRLTLDRDEVLEVKRFCLRHRFPLPALFLGLFGTLLRRYADHENSLLVGSITGYRPQSFLSALGCFYHVLPVVFSGDERASASPISDLAGEMSRYRRNLGDNELVSAMALAGILGDLGSRCFFNYRLAASPRMRGESRRTRFLWDHPADEIHLTLTEHAGELELELRYHPAFFREARFLERLRQFTHLSCRADPPVGELEIVLEDELAEVARVEEPERPAPHGEALAVELFERQVAQRPAATALVFEGASLSYLELDRRANRVAARLRELGAGPDRLVALVLEPSLELVIGILGILKSGGAYVPIDPSLPDRRLRLLLEDTAPVARVGREDTDGRAAQSARECTGETTIPAVVVDDVTKPLPALAESSPFDGHRENHAAYVIYTSGSTGRPKGVVVTHGNLARLFTATEPWFGFGAEDVWTLFHSASFDFSVWEIFGALLHGGRLVVIPADARRSPPDFLELLARQKVTVLNQTPAAFAALVHADENGKPEAHLSLRYVILGGEAVRLSALRPWIRRHGADHPRLINMYGITETTVHSTYRPLTREEIETGHGSPIGISLPDLSIRLLDRRGRSVPPGFPGEIWVGGAGVARGYLERDDLNRERFVSAPAGGGLLYRTGDRARRLPDGELEFLGRLDRQVKIRGFRIELGEVEAALFDHPGIRGGVVVADASSSEESRLLAYTVALEGHRPSISDVLDYLRKRLPEYMVPSHVTFLETLPQTANGKLDRQALPPPGASRPHLSTGFQAPRSATERRLAKIWEELLQVDRVGIHDRFFDLGGHSLAAVRVVSRVRETLGIQLPVCAVFQHPSVAELAAVVESGVESGTGAALVCAAPQPVIELQPLPRDELLACSFSQERVWLLLQMAPESRAYEFAATLRFTGPLDLSVLERTLSELVRRHESFRTTFSDQEGAPVQRVRAPWGVSLPVTDLRSVPEERRQAAAAEAIREATSPPFDLEEEPLVRWSILRLADDDFLLIHNEHHLIHDGWSFIIVLREILELYRAYSQGEDSPLPDPPVQFADFAAWQRKWLPGVLDEQLAFWKRRLADVPPVLSLPLDRPRPAIQTFGGDALRIDLPGQLADQLRSFCRQHEVTPTMALLTAFFALLHRYTGETDLVVGSGVANRRLRESEGVVGMIINNVALRCDLAGDPEVRELARRVRQATLDSLEHQDVPFHLVVDAINPPRIAGVSPIFQAMFSSYDGEMPALELPGIAVRLDEGLSNGSAKFDLNVIAILRQKETADGGAEAPTISLIWEFNTDLFDRATMQRMLEHYQRILTALPAQPSCPVSKLPLLTAAERRQTVTTWNDTRLEYPRDASIDTLFREQVDRAPDAVALSCQDRTISYLELDRGASRLARRLLEAGVEPGTPVGVLMHRSPEAILASLAILRAGGAYVPLDPTYPLQRRLDMQRDSGLSVVVTTGPLCDRLPGFSGQMISVDDPSGHDDAALDLPPPASAESLAHVLYTSGSTGKPKGVGVPHRAVVRLVRSQNYVQLDHDEVLLQLAPLSFDASTFEIWGALLNGGRLAVAPPRPLSLKELGALIEREGVTTLWLTAPLFHQMVDQNLASLRGVRQLLAGGDVLSPSHVRRALEGLPDSAVINGYGPTEGTTFTCCHRMTDPREVGDPVSIGRPVANTRVYVLDAYRQPVPPGVPGELYIAGDGLARGYVGDAQLTARRFVPNPLPEEPEKRLYRSGDRVRMLPNGLLEFMGRFDSQVKIRGFRIEPGEIESVLSDHPAVREAAVVPRQAAAQLTELVAFIALGGQPQPEDLEAYLAARLPPHLIPQHLFFMDELPSTPSGKLDRQALPPVVPSQTIQGVRFSAPESAAERAIARVWSRVLEIEEIDVGRNFFDLGGNSLTILRVHHELSKTVGPRLAIADLFRHPTVRSLARSLGSHGTASDLLADARERDRKRRLKRNPRKHRAHATPLPGKE